MTSEDIFNALIMRSPLLRMQCMEIMRTAMGVGNGNPPKTSKEEVERLLTVYPSRERIVGQDISAAGRLRETSKPESITGIRLLSLVLDSLASAGLLHAVSLNIISNDFGSDIQGITLSFRSSMETPSPDTSGESIPATVTPASPSTGILRDSQPWFTGLPPMLDQ